MIPSFVLKGPDKKRFVIRGAGPWLGASVSRTPWRIPPSN